MAALLLALAALLLGACSQPAKPPEAPAAEQRYALTGDVVSIDSSAGTARIRHDEIKGWMDAMTMDFPVRDKAELARIKPGDRISATVVVRDLDYSLADIEVQPK